MSWIDQARELSTADVASRLGVEVRRGPSASSCKCPVCAAERRHTKSRDRRGAVGIPHKTGGWRCWQCDASGDAIDFVAHVLHSRRYRELDDSGKAAVKAWFTSSGGVYEISVSPANHNARRANVLPPAFENADVNYPPLGEVEDLWNACVPVAANARARAYLDMRSINGPCVDYLAECGVAKALVPGMILPGWAEFGGRKWTETGHELILPLYDHHGVLRAVLARSVDKNPDRKSVAAVGHGRRGLVIAGPIGQLVLRLGASGHFHAQKPLEVSIFEGEIDALRAIAAGVEEPDISEQEYIQHRACFGIFSGSWTRDVASRIPGGSLVLSKTDDDEQGDKYAEAIVSSLGKRVTHERVRIADDRI